MLWLFAGHTKQSWEMPTMCLNRGLMSEQLGSTLSTLKPAGNGKELRQKTKPSSAAITSDWEIFGY